MKPLGRKAYGHIPHLPGSRLGPGDHRVHAGQAAICETKLRDKHDRIYVTEKVDGSCCAVARVNGTLIPLGRAGYLAWTSKYEQHRLFAQWTAEHEALFAFLRDGERVVGEWLAQAHGTRYALPHEPFVAFDLMADDHRVNHEELVARVGSFLPLPRLLHSGSPLAVAEMLKLIAVSGHGAIDPVEGAVWRVERKGRFDFLAKYVRHDKADGKYLPELSGQAPVWNWVPSRNQR